MDEEIIIKPDPALKKLYSKYFQPEDLSQLTPNSHKSLNTNIILSKSRSLSRLKGKIKSRNNNQSFESQKISRAILDKGKEAYEKLMNKMTSLEESKYIQVMTKAKIEKKRMNFFKSLSKPNENRKNGKLTSLPAIGDAKMDPVISKILKARQAASFPYKWKEIVAGGYHNESREGGKMVKVSVLNQNGEKEDRIYLFGGLSRDLQSTLSYLNLPADYNNRQLNWNLVEQSLKIHDLPRFLHAVCVWKNKILIVCGSRLFNKELKQRDCFNDIYMVNPKDNKIIQCSYKGYFAARRAHIAFCIGNSLCVHGGLDSYGNYLSECEFLDMQGAIKQIGVKTSRWLLLKSKGETPGPVAYHAGQLVLSNEKMINIDNIDLRKFVQNDTVKFIEGLYIFGGASKDGFYNDLYVLKFGNMPCEWVKLITKGKSPCARYGHTMNYIQEKSCLMIFGGRTNGSVGYLNDLWIISVIDLDWIKVQYRDINISMPEPRYSHCSEVLNGNLLIFGGLGENSYCNSKLLCLVSEEKLTFEEIMNSDSKETKTIDYPRLPNIKISNKKRSKSVLKNPLNFINLHNI